MLKNWLLKSGTVLILISKIYLQAGRWCNVTAAPQGKKWIFHGENQVTNSKFLVTKGYKLVT